MGGQISVLIFDLDQFKRINDRFGHAQGDHVLKLFATKSKEHLNGTVLSRGLAERNSPPSAGADCSAVGRPRRSPRLRQVGRLHRWTSGGATVSVGAASIRPAKRSQRFVPQGRRGALCGKARRATGSISWSRGHGLVDGGGGTVRASPDRPKAPPPSLPLRPMPRPN